MLLHADRTKRVVVHTRREVWAPSPEPGVERIPLERIGDEIARATSLVRYAAGSRFVSHAHGRGEEILVLDGELRDEHGTYPSGTYVRNPWGTRHAPHAPGGCTLFVRLRQVAPSDRARICVSRAIASLEAEGELVLHVHGSEQTSLARWGAGRSIPSPVDGVEETFVIEGDLEDDLGRYEAGTWLRQPNRGERRAHTRGGCLLFVRRSPD